MSKSQADGLNKLMGDEYYADSAEAPKVGNRPILQAIITKYHGAGNVRGSRISATSGSGVKLYLPYPHELNSEDAHRAAAEALRDKLGWRGELIQGGLETGYAFVFAGEGK